VAAIDPSQNGEQITTPGFIRPERAPPLQLARPCSRSGGGRKRIDLKF
jgi:hypothetical protein